MQSRSDCSIKDVTPREIEPAPSTAQEVNKQNLSTIKSKQFFQNKSPSNLRCGLLNVRYATNKTALIHDTIDENNLDILVMTEVNIAHDAPAAIKNDSAPDGFLCIHAHRLGRKKKSGGGIAIVHNNRIKVTVTDSPRCETFETLCVKVITGSRRVNIIVVYRPPDTKANTLFFTELATLWDLINSSPGDLMVCGDFNCPGEVIGTIDARLLLMAEDCGYTQLVTKPTRKENILDLVFCRSTSQIINKIMVSDI